MVKEKPKKPHVKKPLNAFMLFMKEQRAQVVSECTLRESAAINQILGRKWHELERTEQAKYYEKARQARLEHMQLYPGWSARDNYGLKKKRRRKREKVIGENGELPRKCRARYGLHQLNLWCKPCRRKKKCIRFAGGDDGPGGGGGMMMGPNGFGAFNEGGVGSGGSLNGGNSEDDYDAYDDDDDDDDDDEEDDDETDDDDMEDGHEGGNGPPPAPANRNKNHNHHGHHMPAGNNSLPPNGAGNMHNMPGGAAGMHQLLSQQHHAHHFSPQMQHHQFQQHHANILNQNNGQNPHMQPNMHQINNHLIKSIGGQKTNMQNDLESKALLHHQLRLNQESV